MRDKPATEKTHSHSEVVWDTRDHILSAVCTHTHVSLAKTKDRLLNCRPPGSHNDNHNVVNAVWIPFSPL